MSVASFFRPVVKTLQPYAPAFSVEQIAQKIGYPANEVIKVDSGENMDAQAESILQSPVPFSLARYPDAYASRLCDTLSEYTRCNQNQILVCNGSDEGIDLLCRLFVDPGETVVNFPPTFPMYEVFATIQGANVIQVPRKDDFTIDVKAAKEALQTAKIGFIASPNNPTGTLLSQSSIEELLQVGRPLVIDEAYYEYCGQTVVPLLDRYENLIVLRTLSKWLGLAGLRIGYVLADISVIDALKTIKSPYNTSSISQELAVQALEKKEIFLDKMKKQKEARVIYLQQLGKIPGFRVIPSDAATITLLVLQKKAEAVAQDLLQLGIVVRVVKSSYLPNALRINLSTKAEMQKVLQAIQVVLTE